MMLKQLRVFSAIAQSGSLTRAAELLNLSQPTASRQVQSLERELGVRLVRHGQHPLTLTEEGKVFALLAAQLLEGIEQFGQGADWGDPGIAVAVVATPTMTTHYLPTAVANFANVLPRCSVRIVSRNPVEALSMIQEGDVDFGLLPDPEMPSHFDYRHLFDVEMALVAPRGHQLTRAGIPGLREIARHPLILLRPGLASRKIIEGVFRRSNLVPHAMVEVESTEMVTRLVNLGLGPAIVPNLGFTEKDRQQLAIVSLSEVFPSRRAGIVTLRGQPLTNSATAFVEALVHVVRGTPSDSAVLS